MKTCYLCTRFQTLKHPNDGAIAQLVEHRTENPCVPGSIPGGTTAKSKRPVSPVKRVFFWNARSDIMFFFKVFLNILPTYHFFPIFADDNSEYY